MDMYKLSFIITMYLLSMASCGAQLHNDRLNIYVFTHRYDETGKKYIEETSDFQTIKLLGGYMIDPKKKGVIEMESVKKHLDQLFLNKDESGAICVNLENKYIQNLKKKDIGYEMFKETSLEFQELVVYIKGVRPNVELGVYGIPFRMYYPDQKTRNENYKLDPVLRLTDVIFASLYILHLDKQHGTEANDTYFRKNLDVAFSYADRLENPVLPFILYVVNTGNRRYGGELLGRKEFKRYIDFIYNYRTHAGTGVQGIVWWEPTNQSFRNFLKQPSHLPEEGILLEKHHIL